MSKRIVYKNDAGGISILIPAEDCGLTIEEIAQKDVPEGVKYTIVDAKDIPKDRHFRGAWKISKSKVVEDLETSKEIQKEYIREQRKQMFEELDREFMIALEKGQDTSAIVQRKQKLRDATNHPSILNAKECCHLKDVTLDKILKES